MLFLLLVVYIILSLLVSFLYFPARIHFVHILGADHLGLFYLLQFKTGYFQQRQPITMDFIVTMGLSQRPETLSSTLVQSPFTSSFIEHVCDSLEPL